MKHKRRLTAKGANNLFPGRPDSNTPAYGSSRMPLYSLRFPHQHFDRCWIIGIAGIVELGAVGYEHDHIHFSTHLYIAARFRNTIFKGQFALGGDRQKRIDLFTRSVDWLDAALERDDFMTGWAREQRSAAGLQEDPDE